MHKRSSRSVALAALLAAGASSGARAGAEQKILVGQVTVSPYYWPNFVAVEQGLFKAEHLDVELITIDTPSKTTQSLSANAVNVAWTPPDSILLGRQKGAAMAIIGGAVEKPMYDLITQPRYHAVQDLKGTTLGVSSLKSGSTLLLHYALGRAGLKFPGDYDVIEAGGTPNRLAALRSGGISAAVLTEPETYLAQDEGLVLLAHMSKLVPEYEFLVIGANTDWAKDHREALTTYMKVIVQAMRWLQDAKNKEEAARILGKHIKVPKPDYLRQTYDSMFANLKAMPVDAAVSARAMDALVDVMLANGQVPRRLPWRDAVDDSYRQKALQSVRGP